MCTKTFEKEIKNNYAHSERHCRFETLSFKVKKYCIELH